MISIQNSIMQRPVIQPGASPLHFGQQIQQMIVGSEGSDTGAAAITNGAGKAEFIQQPLHRAEAQVQIGGLKGSP